MCRIVDFFLEISIGDVRLEFNIFQCSEGNFCFTCIDQLDGHLFCLCVWVLRMKLCAGYLHGRHHAHVKFQVSIDLHVMIIWITYSHAKPRFEHVICDNFLFTKWTQSLDWLCIWFWYSHAKPHFEHVHVVCNNFLFTKWSHNAFEHEASIDFAFGSSIHMRSHASNT